MLFDFEALARVHFRTSKPKMSLLKKMYRSIASTRSSLTKRVLHSSAPCVSDVDHGVSPLRWQLVKKSMPSLIVDEQVNITTGHRLWSPVIGYGHRSSVMVTGYGHQLWSPVMVTGYGHQLWSPAMVTGYGHRLWLPIMAGMVKQAIVLLLQLRT